MLDSIIALPNKIGKFILDGLKSLFIPSSSYFSNKFNSLKTSVSGKFGFDTYLELFNALKSYVAGTIDFGGYIDITPWLKYMPILYNYIRGFYYVLALLFNIRMFIYLVRGSDLSKGGK